MRSELQENIQRMSPKFSEVIMLPQTKAIALYMNSKQNLPEVDMESIMTEKRRGAITCLVLCTMKRGDQAIRCFADALRVELEMKDLADELCPDGMDNLLQKTFRRMFPTFSEVMTLYQAKAIALYMNSMQNLTEEKMDEVLCQKGPGVITSLLWCIVEREDDEAIRCFADALREVMKNGSLADELCPDGRCDWMNSRLQNTLIRMRYTISKAITLHQASDIVEYMYSKGNLSEMDRDDILSQGNCQDVVYSLLFCTTKRGDPAIRCFADALRVRLKMDLANELCPDGNFNWMNGLLKNTFLQMRYTFSKAIMLHQAKAIALYMNSKGHLAGVELDDILSQENCQDAVYSLLFCTTKRGDSAIRCFLDALRVKLEMVGLVDELFPGGRYGQVGPDSTLGAEAAVISDPEAYRTDADEQFKRCAQVGPVAALRTAAAVRDPVAYRTNADEQLAYKLDFQRRGKAIIISIAEFQDQRCNLQGIARDGEALKQFFDECRFEVQLSVNRNGPNQEMFCREAIVRRLKEEANKDYRDYAMLVCAVVSHGDTKDNKSCIMDYKGEPIYTDEIVDLFKGSQSLSGKPKVFIFHACRGDEEEKQVPLAPGSWQPQSPLRQFTTCSADFLIFYSTVKGHKSYAARDDTSVFVKTMLHWLRTSKRDTLSVFTDVIREIVTPTSSSRAVHTPCIESTLTKALYISFFLPNF